MIADRFLKISYFRSSIVERSEYTFFEFVIMSIITSIIMSTVMLTVMSTDEKRKWKRYLTKKWYSDIVNWLLNEKLQIKNKKYHLINIKNERVLVY